jgi:hypothetical protein
LSAEVTAGPARKNLGEEFFVRGNAAYDAGDYGLALEMFDKAIDSGMESEIVFNGTPRPSPATRRPLPSPGPMSSRGITWAIRSTRRRRTGPQRTLTPARPP